MNKNYWKKYHLISFVRKECKIQLHADIGSCECWQVSQAPHSAKNRPTSKIGIVLNSWTAQAEIIAAICFLDTSWVKLQRKTVSNCLAWPLCQEAGAAFAKKDLTFKRATGGASGNSPVKDHWTPCSGRYLKTLQNQEWRSSKHIKGTSN